MMFTYNYATGNKYMKPGIYDGISNDDYHHGPGVSKSGLDLIHRSPMHFNAVMTAANDRLPTEAQEMGTAFHTLLLEPHIFVTDYTLSLRQQDVPEAIAEKDVLSALVAELNKGREAKLPSTGTKAELIERIMANSVCGELSVLESQPATELKAIITELNQHRHGLLSTTGTMESLAQSLRDAGMPITLWNDVKAEWMQNNGHRKVLTPDQLDTLMGMRDSVMAHPAARALLTAVPGVAERSAYWTDPVTGELCRCRPDFWRNDGIIVDLKSTEDASPDGFAKSIANWRYHVQHPFYVDGLQLAMTQGGIHQAPGGLFPRTFVFLAVEKRAPYAVGVYVMDQDSIELGRAEYRADLARYAACRATDNWPGYGDKIQNITVPPWLFSKNAHLLNAA
jgi:exodeoxyribonuclease VIII